MYIKNVVLENFRNYKNLDIELSDYNLFYGENGQGKTNILEAIHLSSVGKSHRTNKENELIKIGEKYFKIFINYNKNSNDKNILISKKENQKKQIELNEIKITRIGEIIGEITTVMFSPEDMKLIKEGPGERRKFIDMAISQLRPTYFYELQKYAKILDQRNALLKEINKTGILSDTLDIWDEMMSESAAYIQKARNEFINQIKEYVLFYHSKITTETEKLKINYLKNIQIEEGSSKEDQKRQILSELKKKRNVDISRMTSIIGPHRDDILLYLNGNDIKIYGSQGQQRTAVLALKLSEIEYINEQKGFYPVLILDDVESELDDSRRRELTNTIKKMQTIVTGTKQRSILKERFFIYNISNGASKRII